MQTLAWIEPPLLILAQEIHQPPKRARIAPIPRGEGLESIFSALNSGRSSPCPARRPRNVDQRDGSWMPRTPLIHQREVAPRQSGRKRLDTVCFLNIWGKTPAERSAIKSRALDRTRWREIIMEERIEQLQESPSPPEERNKRVQESPSPSSLAQNRAPRRRAKALEERST